MACDSSRLESPHVFSRIGTPTHEYACAVTVRSATSASNNQTAPVATSGELRSFWVPLLGILLVASAVRFAGLGADDYWLDELHSLANSAGKRAAFEDVPYGVIFRDVDRSTDLDSGSTCGAVWETLRNDSHPPTYFLLLLGWRKWFGDSEMAVRSLAAAFSVLSLLPVAMLLRTLGRPREGLYAALLLAVAFAHIQMGQQNRQYSLSILFVGCSYLMLVYGEGCWSHQSVRKRVWGSVLYGLTLYLSVLTHYFAGLALLGHVAYASVRFQRSVLRHWIAAVIVACVAACVTWLGVFLDQLDFIGSQPWLSESAPDHVAQSLLRFFDLPIRLLFQADPFKTFAWRSLLGLALIVTVIVACVRRKERAALIFALWFLVPCAGFLFLDLIAHKQLLSHLRYPVVALPGIVGLIVLASASLPRVGRWVLISALVVAIASRMQFPATDNPQARLAVAELASRVAPNDLVIYDAVGWPNHWIPHFYAPMAYYMPEFENAVLLLREEMSPDVRAQVEAFEYIFVVSPRSPESGHEIPHPAPSTHRLTARSGYIHHIGWIYRFTRNGSV